MVVKVILARLFSGKKIKQCADLAERRQTAMAGLLMGAVNFADISERTEIEDSDSKIPSAFTSIRHTEPVEGSRGYTQPWRSRDRMKTVSVALVLCLNVGVDPPDVVKTSPCARLEAWIDPVSSSPQKALEIIGNHLQKQYERWQSRARYKQSLDPTAEDVKKLCISLRRNAKEERVLFHYNGHGVPKPTLNGEIWVFNKSYTQYIPLSIYDLQTWMGGPSIFVYDCSCAGIIVDSFIQFSKQREEEREHMPNGLPSVSVKNCIQLAACSSNELLPMNPELPADLFTSCLTTPIKIALQWMCLQKKKKLVEGITLELLDKIPGRLSDRRTPLGELNWIFTAITDTIAWNMLPKDLFQRLFRQDLLVASLFRNFLMAERIMRSYNCNPSSYPKLPPTYYHPMWEAWDLAVDHCLSQVERVLEGAEYVHSPFFAEQLTAFEVWLSFGSEFRRPPEQLPIVLQVLLSQVHRLRALDLLGKFLDLGPWAVILALSVGIFPYVLKLLQSSARELRNHLVFIWAKILAVDSSCQAELVKDNGHKYFLSVLADPHMPAKRRTMAAFVLASIVDSYPTGQEVCLQDNLVSLCLDQLSDEHMELQQWLLICLARIWTDYNSARWCGVRDSAPEKIYTMLNSPYPEVRAAAVYSLGTFIGNTEDRTDHANTIDHSVAMNLLNVSEDSSPIVRRELVASLYQLVSQFESSFAKVAVQFIETDLKLREEKMIKGPTGSWVYLNPEYPTTKPSLSAGISAASSLTNLEVEGGEIPSTAVLSPSSMRRVSSATSIAGTFSGVYVQVWRVLLRLSYDPYPSVSKAAKKITVHIQNKASQSAQPQMVKEHKKFSSSSSTSAPSSPIHFNLSKSMSPQLGISPDLSQPPTGGLTLPHEIARPIALHPGEDPPPARPQNPAPIGSQYPHSQSFSRSRKMFDKGPSQSTQDKVNDSLSSTSSRELDVQTEFVDWSSKLFTHSSTLKSVEEMERDNTVYYEKEWKLRRNKLIREYGKDECQEFGQVNIDDQIFIIKNQGTPLGLKFHPYESHLAAFDKSGICIWNWEQGSKINYFSNSGPPNAKITSMDFINSHHSTLIYTGMDDGNVKIWRNYLGEPDYPVMLVTAWQALPEMLHSIRGSGLILEWDQENCHMIASGDSRIIRVWDVNAEKKCQDLSTGAESCVTSLAYDSINRSLLIAGCGDGTVRLYDRRSDNLERTFREHPAWVTNVCLQRSGNHNIISASMNGDVRYWDPRFTESLKTVNTVQNLTALELHEAAGVFASGSSNQLITLSNLEDGEQRCSIKYHEGFMGQKIGPINALAFHPYTILLAAGCADSFLSVYRARRH